MILNVDSNILWGTFSSEYIGRQQHSNVCITAAGSWEPVVAGEYLMREWILSLGRLSTVWTLSPAHKHTQTHQVVQFSFSAVLQSYAEQVPVKVMSPWWKAHQTVTRLAIDSLKTHSSTHAGSYSFHFSLVAFKWQERNTKRERQRCNWALRRARAHAFMQLSLYSSLKDYIVVIESFCPLISFVCCFLFVAQSFQIIMHL